MRPSRAAATTLAIALAALAHLAPASRAGAQNDNSISVDDFATGRRGHALTSSVPLRRGVTTKVHIVKNFIDLVSFNDVTISGGGTIGGLTNGRTQGGEGMGFLAMNITVPATQNVGSTITLRVGSGDVFRFRAVHQGRIATITRNPDPATIQGTDIGDAIVRPTSCHVITHTGRTANAVTATLTKNASCSVNAFGTALQGSSSDDPPSYHLADGSVAGFQFQYAPAGVACVSQPGIGAPTVRQPLVDQVIVFQPGTPSPANVTIRWDSATSNSVVAPRNEWIVSLPVRRDLGLLALPANFTVTGLSKTLSLAIPGTHSVTVKPKNCGATAPSTTVTFTTRYP